MRALRGLGMLLTAVEVLAQGGGARGAGQNPPLASLKTVAPPKATGLDRHVQDETALVALTAIVAFLKALSDDRVRFQRAPFDHPFLCVPNGHVATGGEFAIDASQSGSVAADKWALVPEVGRAGGSVPLQTFEELLNGIGSDGTRANTMTVACRP
jgi:hypothetical protein